MADINLSTSRKIANLINIPIDLADNIVRYRKKNGFFQEFDDLMNVDRISRTVLKRIKNKMVLKKSTAKHDKKYPVSKNVNKPGKKARKKITSAKMERNKNSKFNPIMFPLLRFDDTGSSPMSPGPSAVTLYTPVKVQPSNSGNKIMAEYRLLSPDTGTKNHDSETISSHLSTKVNAPSIYKCKEGRPNTGNYRTLSQNKENSIRSWLNRIQHHSPIRSPSISRNSSPPKSILHRNETKDHTSTRRKQSRDGNVKYSLGKLNSTRPKQATPTISTPQRHASRKKMPNTITDKKRQSLCKQGITSNAAHASPTRAKGYGTLSKSHHKSTPRRKQNIKENEIKRPNRESVYRVTGSSPRSLSRGSRSMSSRQRMKSYQELLARSPDSVDDQTYICRSSVVRKRSVTPVSLASSRQDSDDSIFSSDASLLSHDNNDREHDRTRRDKRHRSSRDKEGHRRHRSPKRNRQDDQAPLCSIL